MLLKRTRTRKMRKSRKTRKMRKMRKTRRGGGKNKSLAQLIKSSAATGMLPTMTRLTPEQQLEMEKIQQQADLERESLEKRKSAWSKRQMTQPYVSLQYNSRDEQENEEAKAADEYYREKHVHF